ncbi:hypothetical protein Patl1_20503 [Pistacia atlantica]|uniref:Uncharacterized protein n=1 Tax=Pistacia atlantica TaxID=434234 RepID=A0ACC1BK59_9ROSI|nr:hypothetical protein Patl1_20503 [Pistacia atlantica]
MLEKIGLPTKPSLRGSNWVVDASHCQGCTSQFTFINRKHHCRRCGGLFCNSCTQQRMYLRGQGDSPVRICEPCKKLEEAARFEMRHGHKARVSRGSSKLAVKDEDEVLNQILGTDGKGLVSNKDLGSSMQRATSSASCSNTQDGLGDMHRSISVDDQNPPQNDIGSASPEELRQRAVEEKKKYKILKGEGKPEEALKAFKRGKELERQADALEISLRKNRKRVLSSGNGAEIQNKDIFKESGRNNKLLPKVGAEKDNFAAELRELGWSDMDIQHEDKKSASMSLEGELSSLLGDISQKTGKNTGTHGIDTSPVIALKRKALILKREGKLAEAKEELKRAKILEKELEEQQLLAGAEESDDELSAIVRSVDNDEEDDFPIQYEREANLDHFDITVDDLGVDCNFEVTDEDMEDPEIAGALKSLGWTEDSDLADNVAPQSVPVDREALSREILSLKKEALNYKRAGNVAEAMAQLKKAMLLEQDLEITHTGSISQADEKLSQKTKVDDKNTEFTKDMHSKVAPKSKLMIQKELLGLKKKALALRREGRFDEAEEELKKGKVLEHQLEEMDNASKVQATGNKESDLTFKHSVASVDLPVGEGEDDVTDQDMNDPTYLSILSNLGWNDEDNGSSSQQLQPSNLKRSKGEIQRELLNLKRKALALRRKGETEEAEELLKMAKVLEAQMEELEAPKENLLDASKNKKSGSFESLKNHDTQENLVHEVGVNTGSAPVAVDSNDNAVESSPLVKSNHRLLGEVGPTGETDVTGYKGAAEGTTFIPLTSQSLNSMDLLIGNNWTSSQIAAGKPEDKRNLGSEISSLARSSVQMDSSSKLHENLGSKNDVQNDKREVVQANENPLIHEANSVHVSASQNNQTSLRQEVLARKRKAIALKREGKSAEAREELRQAKLLEKKLEDDSIQPKSSPPDVSVTTSNLPSVGQKQHDTSNSAPKPLSARDRFKLQQESLSHKRKALKLRREGRMDEAEAEFEMAKNLESQLEELTAHDSKSSVNEAEPVDDIGVEDLLDPQLLSALKAIGINDPNVVTQGPKSEEPMKHSGGKSENLGKERIQLEERPEPSKHSAGKSESFSQEKIQLEERIKAEKVKALNLKRSGKQAEALDALRRAKLFERKLNSLASN